VINLLDPDKKLIKYRLYRNSCIGLGSTYVKELGVLGRDLTKTIIVDNSLHCFVYNVRYQKIKNNS
jgi:CTD small phosphatase-like protein 2